MITAYGTGTAKSPWGTDYKAHLATITPPSIPSVSGPVSISAGGPAAAPFIADAGFSGGLVTSNWSGAVDTSLVTNVTPAPLSVYQHERYGTFSYTVSQLTASKAYTVNLHFTEDFETAAGRRLENVSINGAQVLSSFDIFGATGAQHKAIVKTFTANADTSGNIVISFAPTPSSPDQAAKVDGVEVLAIIPSSTANLTAIPTSITSGQSSTLTWSSTNATSCTGTGFSTGNAVSGSVGVSPSATTTYTVSCTNGGTPATASVKVTVTVPAQTSQIEDFQYLAGDWYLPDLALPAYGTTGVPGASTIRCVPAGLRNKATINNVGTRVYTADSAGHLQFAIYTNGTNMRPANLVSTSASMSLATAGVISSALGSKVQGGPGGANFTDTFWFCSNTDSTKATFSSVNTTTAFGQSIIGASTAGNVLQASGSGVVISHLSCSGSACNGGSSTYGAWPSSLAGAGWTEQTTIKMPMMAIQFVSVP
jgi:hypothetical protein